jgi:hypothetical protein
MRPRDGGLKGVGGRIACVTVLVLLSACAHHRANVGPGASNLPAPTPVAPRDQSVFTNHPRTVRFAWSRVPQAAAYGIEIDCLGCCVRDRWCSEAQGKGYLVPNLTAITYTFTFWGDQKGRWRVWAVDARSRPGVKSAWSGFTFQAGREEADPKKPSPFGGPAGRH